MKSFRHSMQRSVFLSLQAFLSALCLLVALGCVTYAQTKFPPLTGYVNDVAHLLDNTTKQNLTEKLTELEEKTGDQIVIVTLPTLSGHDIETYSNSLFRTWRLGQQQLNNGVLLVIAPNEREVRIEVGYGLEGELTDAISSVIINTFILPNFRKGNYQKGVIEAVHAIINVITESNSEFSFRIREKAKIVEAQRKQAEKEQMIINTIIVLVFLIIFGLPILAMIFGKKVGPQKYLWMGIIFTPWFLNLRAGGRYHSGRFGDPSGGGGFRGGGGSSGGGGATGRW
ncbi:TPM domain-containing protein [Bartonella vinsonii]|uniref:Putative membrane protein n=1 Tax=Bartonella vinsonii subsp. berkhoffii str. Tweed TaxID=1094502 RepID=N6UW73_BARVB|nr:YgcG family protein [Bartonella vinsonii]ENN94328.1 putative membrane protein [Bartonella vinsonii subsp. berkhoffii str. Tweed]